MRAVETRITPNCGGGTHSTRMRTMRNIPRTCGQIKTAQEEFAQREAVS